MYVTEANDVKIFNLSAGKSLPEWLTDRRKRAKLVKTIDSKGQIELIQDFNMPGVSTSIRMSPNYQYILATGTYKPRVKCFDVCNLSIKFERCFDSEVISFESISDDYSKLVFLQCDRYIEIHSAAGRLYRLRIPCFGRGMKYHPSSCDLFMVGTSKEIYRLNLERGQFLQPYETNTYSLNTCDINPEHGLLLVGSMEGTIEAWDPRTKKRCAILDVAIKLPNTKYFPSVSVLKFKNALHMAVGTGSGHILLYDIRSKEPLLIKDHLNKLPIKRIAFNTNCKAVYTMDEAMLKIWDEYTGKQIAYIDSPSSFNDFCTIPSTGILFLAQEDTKMLTYYIPAMGSAPKWCSFLDSITDEIASDVVEHIYDDYQFVTSKELAELGLEHLIGSGLLKGYMHGYFMDARFYNKTKAAIEPFAYERFRKERIQQEMENKCKSRVQITSKLPKINQDLAVKILEETSYLRNSNRKQSSQNMPNLLEDKRFKAIFENQDFIIDKNSDEFKLLAPKLNYLNKLKIKENAKTKIKQMTNHEKNNESEDNGNESNDDDLFDLEKKYEHNTHFEESSDDDRNMNEFVKEMKKTYKDAKKKKKEPLI